MTPLDGIPITVSRMLCEVKFLRWRRTHRRARIRKKWRKRYGMVLAKCPGVSYRLLGVGLICCPCVFTMLAEAASKRPATVPTVNVPPVVAVNSV